MSISARRKPEKAAYHHGNLRAALLEAARGLVAEAGLDGFGLREVARRAGVSHAAVYNHFANRSALVEALAIEALAAFTAALRAAERTADDPLLRLERVGIAYVRFAFEHQAEFRFMFRPEICKEPLVGGDGGSLGLAARESYLPLEETIAACLASGAIRGDAQTIALTAWSGVHGLASLIVDGPLRDTALDLHAVEALAQGVTATLCRIAAT
jgi:AcrR family transcriptional regulator